MGRYVTACVAATDDDAFVLRVGAILRFDLACQLLRDSSASMALITEVLGYGHTSTFSRAFSRWAKMSPREWRRAAASVDWRV